MSILFRRYQKDLYAGNQIIFGKTFYLFLFELSEGTGPVAPQGILDGMIQSYVCSHFYRIS